MSDSAIKYRPAARMLHWGMAALVFGMIPAGVVMVQPDLNRSLQDTLFLFHKNVGVLLLLLLLLRAFYRWRHPPAALPAGLPVWQRTIAALTHRLLYALLLIMPLAGYVRVKAGGFPIETLDRFGIPSLVPRSDALAEFAKTVHYVGGIAIAGLIALHVAGAVYHGIWRRDGIFSRMWPPFTWRGG